jgi:hypothetical protein
MQDISRLIMKIGANIEQHAPWVGIVGLAHISTMLKLR